MSRYLLVTLGIGVCSALVASLAHLFGAFQPMAESLHQAYSEQGLFFGGDVVRLPWLEILLSVAAGVGVAWAVVDLPGLSRKGLVVLCCVLLVVVLSPVLALHHWLFDPSSTLLSVLLSALGGYIFSRTTLGMRRGLLVDLFGSRISHEKFLSLLNSEDELPVESRRISVTVLSCRLLNHADVKEKISPKDWVAISNFFLRSVETFLIRSGAYLDETHGESLRACFGVLGEPTHHEEEACRVALQLHSRLRNLSRECESRWFHPLVFGIGVESGEVTTGVFGDRLSARLSLVGEVNDIAYRLAAANPSSVRDVVVGPSLFSAVKEQFVFRPLEMFYDPSTKVLSEIYHLLDHKDRYSEAAQKGLDLFWKGMILLREKRFEEALEAFSMSRAVSGYDPVLEHFVGSIQEHISQPEASRFETRDENPKRGHARLINRL